MISKIVLCAFPNRLTAGLWRLGGMVSCETFDNDETGLNGFRNFLHRHRSIPIFLIADAVEEDYRVESAPHTSGRARQALLDRKLNQLYRNSSYRAAQFIGREPLQRRDDQFLMVALSNAESIHPWVLAMEEQHAPLAGVYLLPMVSQYLLDRLKLRAPHLLMIDGLLPGLRQTYFHNGKLRVSRLAPETANAEARRAQLYMSETEKTRLYLLSQRLIAADTKLSLLVLTDPREGEEVCRVVGSEMEIDCVALDAQKLGARYGLDAQALQQFPELLYMQLVAKGASPVNLAPAAQGWHYRINRLSAWIGYAAAAVLVGGIAMGMLDLKSASDYREQFAQAEMQTRDYERRYDEVARNFPATPLPGTDLKIVVELAQTLAANSKTPQRLMQVVSSALDAAPEIQLQRLRWKLTNDINVVDDANSSTAQNAKPVMTGGGDGKLHEVGFIDGEIRNFTGDYRLALNSVTHLAELIQKDARVEQVVVVQQPVNVSSYTNLHGSTLDAHTQQMPAAQFKLKLVLKSAVNS